jgi:hypothetical protein
MGRLLYWIVAAILVVIAIILILNATHAGAGIGPDGFAFYAKQGIRNENIQIYGGIQNDPWIVTCTDAPNFVKLTDTVTCHIHQ